MNCKFLISNKAYRINRSTEGKSARSEDKLNTDRGDAIDTIRSTMSTSRAQIALAALSAEKMDLENKLAQIENALESENRKQLHRPRGKK